MTEEHWGIGVAPFAVLTIELKNMHLSDAGTTILKRRSGSQQLFL